MIIGILALQGDYQLHKDLLDNNGIESILVKNSTELNIIDGLIIPGGESSVMLKLIEKYSLREPLQNFGKFKNIFGTCAGAIIMSVETSSYENTLRLIDIKSNRNYWGPQINSFTKNIDIDFIEDTFECHFIRAPKLTCLNDSTKILSKLDASPVLVRNDKHLVSSFHPEMTRDFSIHNYFLGMINE